MSPRSISFLHTLLTMTFNIPRTLNLLMLIGINSFMDDSCELCSSVILKNQKLLTIQLISLLLFVIAGHQIWIIELDMSALV
jgi:hypothetical protein